MNFPINSVMMPEVLNRHSGNKCAYTLTDERFMSRNAPNPAREKTVKKAIKSKLLPWFAVNRRDLPWRRNRTPYRVWVAEIMLQQTRVDTVIDYYRRWMKSFPSWRVLARAPQADVLKAWEGLGYYSRARNLHAAAKIITGEYNGNLSKAWKNPPQSSLSPALKLRRKGGVGETVSKVRKKSSEKFQGLEEPDLPHLRKCGRSPKWGGKGDSYAQNIERHLRGLSEIEKKEVFPAEAQRTQRFSKPAASALRTLRLSGESPVQPLEQFLQKLPGIGAYTAAAIASLAFGEDSAVVDGNVIRVLCRLFAFGGDPKTVEGKKKMQNWADELMVEGRAGEYNEAMMELGALVCLPKTPKCSDCPLQSICAAFVKGKPDAYPVMKKKKKVPHLVVGAAVTVNRKGEVMIAQRKQTDMLGGLWEFPGGKLEPGETIEECIARELKEELGINVEVGDFLMTVKHAYSHFTMTMHVYFTKIISGRPRVIDCADYKWIKPSDLLKHAYSKADLHVVAKLQGEGRS